jgi:hypothetical protein
MHEEQKAIVSDSLFFLKCDWSSKGSFIEMLKVAFVSLLQNIASKTFELMVIVGPEGLAFGASSNELDVSSRHLFFLLPFDQFGLLAGVFLHPVGDANESFSTTVPVYFFKVTHQVEGELGIEVETVGHGGEEESGCFFVRRTTVMSDVFNGCFLFF